MPWAGITIGGRTVGLYAGGGGCSATISIVRWPGGIQPSSLLGKSGVLAMRLMLACSCRES